MTLKARGKKREKARRGDQIARASLNKVSNNHGAGADGAQEAAIWLGRADGARRRVGNGCS